MKTKLLFDKKRHGDKIGSNAIMVDGYTVAEIEALIDSPDHKVHDLNAWVETDSINLTENVLQSEGFVNATNNEYITFKNYTRYRLNLAGTKCLIKIGSNSKVWEEIATNDQLEAFLNKFGGKASLFIESLQPAKLEEYQLKSKEDLEALTWVELKNYLKLHKIDGPYDLRSEAPARAALYEDMDAGKYDMNREYISPEE